MAIKFKSAMTEQELLSILGLPSDLLSSKGFTLKLGISEIKIFASGTAAYCKSFSESLALYLANNASEPLITIQTGTIISSLKNHIQVVSNLQELLPSLVDCLTTSSLNVAKLPYSCTANSTVNIKEVLDVLWGNLLLSPIIPTAPFVNINMDSAVGESHQATKVSIPAKTIAQIVLEDRVKLVDATHLYQPVFGTSNNAIYYVIAISQEGLKIAIKKPSDQISIRVEGVKSVKPEVLNRLANFGITNHDGYSSGHFNISKTTASRVVGALLMDLNLTWVTPTPDVKALEAVA